MRDDKCAVGNDDDGDNDGGGEYVLKDDDDDEGMMMTIMMCEYEKAGIVFTIKFAPLAWRRCNTKSHN